MSTSYLYVHWMSIQKSIYSTWNRKYHVWKPYASWNEVGLVFPILYFAGCRIYDLVWHSLGNVSVSFSGVLRSTTVGKQHHYWQSNLITRQKLVYLLLHVHPLPEGWSSVDLITFDHVLFTCFTDCLVFYNASVAINWTPRCYFFFCTLTIQRTPHPLKGHHQISTADLPANTKRNFIIMFNTHYVKISYPNFILIFLYRITTNILTTICNTRYRNFQSTNKCTYRPLWRLALRWLCIRPETCS